MARSISPRLTALLALIACIALAMVSLPALSAPESGRTWYVATGGKSGAAGSSAAPWSLDWAFDPRNVAVKPGDTVLISSGTYRSDGAPFRPSRSGTTERPVTYRAAAGTKPVLDASLPAPRWRRIAGPTPVWESEAPIADPGRGYQVGGSLEIGGQWWPLMPGRYGDTAQLEARSDRYRPDGRFYPGPMIVLMPDGRLRIRLDPPGADTMLGQKIARLSDLDPNRARLSLSVGGAVIDNRASHVRFDGLALTGGVTSYVAASGETGVVLANGSDTPFYNSFNLGGQSEGRIDNWVSDGGMRPGWWIAYVDIKGGVTVAEGVRKVAVRTGKSGGEARGWKITRSTFRNFFDGFLGEGRDFEIGGGDTHDAAWALGNRFENIWDDAIQFYAANQGWDVHHNRFLGAGVSRDGASSAAARGERWPLIHHNIFDPREARIFYGRGGAVDGDDGRVLEGFRYAQPLSSHGLRSGRGAFAFPWRFYANTVAWVSPTLLPDMNLLTQDAEGKGVNLIASNLFLVTNGTPPWLARDAWPAAGRDQLLGNLFAAPSGWRVETEKNRTMPLVRFIHGKGGALNDDSQGNGWSSPAAIERSGGWARGNALIARDGAALVDRDYRPQGEAARGAADLSASGMPFTKPATAWRGAVAPR